MKPINFAVVGKGFIFSRHKQAIESIGGKVYLTCDNDPKKKADFKDWVEMFNHPKFKKVTHVSICAPNYLHGVIAREAILRRKKVLCEKPLVIDGNFEGLDEVKTVMQLRHHPEIKKLKGKNITSIYVEAKMFRDRKYWNSWKGNDVKAGGVLYNLGVHYIDLLAHLMGDNWIVAETTSSRKLASGAIYFGEYWNKFASYHIEIVNKRSDQGRKIIVDGEEISLSDKDNLSYEDLHKEVYKDFIAGKGISLKEAKKSLFLISRLLNNG